MSSLPPPPPADLEQALAAVRFAPLDELFEIAAPLYAKPANDELALAVIASAVVERLQSVGDDLFSSGADQLGAVLSRASASAGSQALFAAVMQQPVFRS